jgi:acyl-CoA thioesterase-1
MDDVRALFFGDSFTAGTGDPAALGWVGRVVATGLAQGVPLTGYNLGIRRETSAEVAARWAAEAAPRMAVEAEYRVVFSAGTNDTTVEDGRVRVDHDRSVAALGGMLDGARDLGVPAFVVGPPPAGEPGQDDRIAALSAAFSENVCAPRAVPYVPVVEALRTPGAWTREAAEGDGTHPGAGGYEHLARLVLDAGFLDWLRLPAGVGARVTEVPKRSGPLG